MNRTKMKFISLLIAPVFLIMGCSNEKKTDHSSEKTDHSMHNINGESNSYCDSVNNGLIAEDTLKGSPKRTAMATIDGTHIHIEYGSPGVKGRTIWGGLVAYDKVWVTGAHNATMVQFSKTVEIGNKTIPPGIYSFFTIPGEKKWIAIFNSRYEQHLADEYNEKEDIIRLNVDPEENPMTQRLTYNIISLNNASAIIMQWEKKKITIPFKIITK
jgi:Protein of unknown function (DUF2911)